MDEFDRSKVIRRPILTEDRLSGLPDELLHQIFSCIETKFVVQTCLLSPRWKIFWRSMPCLTLSSQEFDSLPKFSKFVTKVLSRRNHQIDVSSIKLIFNGPGSQAFVKRIAGYAFSHSVQELIVSSSPGNTHGLPLCLFRGSLSLKHFTFSSIGLDAYFHTPKTPWDFPVLTTLHLFTVTLRGKYTGDSIDLFSKCLNLKNLTLKRFIVSYEAVFDIITPRLENLMLINYSSYPNNVVNVIAPQLENLTVIDCSFKYLNAPPGISSFCYKNDHRLPLLQLPNCCFHSLNKASVTLKSSSSNMPYKEQVARNTINMLQKLHSARFLTLNLGVVECLSSFPDIVSHHSSPFSNLVCLNIDSSRAEAYKVKLSIATRDFLLENSPNATLITDLPEEPSIKEMLEKVATKKKAKPTKEDVKRHMMELQVSVKKQENMLLTKACISKLMAILPKALALEKKMQTDSNKRAQTEAELAQLTVSIQACMGRLHDLYRQEYKNFEAIHSKEKQIITLLLKIPTQDRTLYTRRPKVTQKLHRRLVSTVEDLSFCTKTSLMFIKNMCLIISQHFKT